MSKTRAAKVVEEVEISEEERLELELAEKARQSSGDWDSVAPGKAKNFGQSFGRLVGLLRPSALAFVGVSLLGTLGVVLAVLAPRVLGEATNLIFEGFISSQLSCCDRTDRPTWRTWSGPCRTSCPAKGSTSYV
jgi:ATP-binding cassette subfamily B multidrug efflux pump